MKLSNYFAIAAHSVGASKNYLGAMYRRTAARKGRKRAGIEEISKINCVFLIVNNLY